MIGTHAVNLFRSVPKWGSVLNTNPYMTSNVIGWQGAPFEPALTWAADGWAVQPRGGSIARAQTDANPTARAAGDRSYRVRARVTVPVATSMRLGVFLANTVGDVWRGPFWAGPTNAAEVWSPFRNLPAGTHDLEAVLSVPGAFRPEFALIGPTLNSQIRPDTSAGPNRVDYVEMFTLAASDAADLSCFVDEVAIRHGRSDTTSQPEASAATVNLSWDAATDSLPALAEVGAALEVTTTLPGGTRARFTGRITDVALGWDEAAADTPNEQQAQISAVGTLADLGRRLVGAEPWPVENDAQRVARVAALAEMPLDPMVSDPGTVQILARDVDSQPALGIMREVAASAQGIVWQTVGGDLRYADNGHRRVVAVGLELDDCDVLVTPTWVRNQDGLVNEVSLGYGVAPEGGQQPRYLATNPTSQTKWGRYAYTTETLLAALADAEAMGTLLMRRNYQPVWVLGTIPVDVAGLSEADTDRLLSLDVGDLVHLANLPAIGTAPTEVYAWVEGWAERLAAGVHEVDLVLSDYCRTTPPLRWDDHLGMTWDAVPNPTTRTWDEALCWGGPSPGAGRWDDTPTALRWDQVAASVTWDTWVQPTYEGA